MKNKQQLQSMNLLYKNISLQLMGELNRKIPDHALIKDYRKQLLQLDRGIRVIQFSRE